MSFLDDIRKQPQHHREIMFGLCVITAVSLVGMVWYNSFEKNLYVLLNPEDGADQRFLAETKAVPSLLGDISKTGQDLKATLYNIFSSMGGLVGSDERGTIKDDTKPGVPERVYTLPMSEEK